MFKEGITFKIKKILAIASIIFVFIFANSTQAATMTVQASASRVDVNNLFTVRVYVNSQNVTINNAEATINFPSDLVEVVSVDSKSSIFSMWVDPPAFSNANGTVTFNGGVANPGYNGSGGQLLGVVFKAKKPGVASIFFSGPAIKANDGLGTDVLTGQNSVDVTIVGSVEQPTVENPKPTVEPPKPTTPVSTNKVVVTSPTNPDPNAWYSSSNVTVEWKNQADVRSIQVLLSTNPGVTPTKELPVDTTSRVINGIDDGVSYFLIREKTPQGWTDVTAYKLQIDSAAPHDVSFTASANDDGSTKLMLLATDDTSGIRNYTISIDGANPVVTAESTYNVLLAPGKHTVILTAIDRAENKNDYKSEITVFALVAPKITNYTASVNFGDPIYAEGTSVYPKANLNVSVKSVYGVVTDYDVQTDDAGKFAFRSEPQNVSGDYELWVAAANSDGTKGPASKRVKVFVEQNASLLGRIYRAVFSFSMLIVLLILLLLALAGIGWYKFLILRWQYRMLKKKYDEDEAEKKQLKPEQRIMPRETPAPVITPTIKKEKVVKRVSPTKKNNASSKKNDVY